MSGLMQERLCSGQAFVKSRLPHIPAPLHRAAQPDQPEPRLDTVEVWRRKL